MEPPCQAWREALLTADFAVELVVSGLLASLPEYAHQHVRAPLVEHVTAADGNATWLHSLLLGNPLVPDTVSSDAMFAGALAAPTAVALALSLAVPGPRFAVRAWAHSFILGLGLTVAVTDLTKRYVGYPRPWFFAECAFDPAAGRCADHAALGHASRSFPSGHSSVSLFAGLHTSLRLIGAMRLGHAARRLGPLDATNLLLLACLLPALLAGWVAASRVRDNAHHPADVVGGALIGGSVALLTYFRHFEALFGARGGHPRLPVDARRADAVEGATDALHADSPASDLLHDSPHGPRHINTYS